MPSSKPIAFFDSGIGGVSVLRETVRLMPNENYLYYGDSLHAPYGAKSAAEVLELCRSAARYLTEIGIKALVIACNTATSAAVNTLRSEYPDLLIIGTEPAVKPAVERHAGGRILVMATPMTLKEEKFRLLQEQFQAAAEIIPVPCAGLMEFVEQGILDGEEVERFLMEKLEPYRNVPVDAIVLGCTHYPFLADAIRRVAGNRAEILDGSSGIARHLQNCLAQRDLLNPSTQKGTVEFRNSLDDEEVLALGKRLLDCGCGADA